VPDLKITGLDLSLTSTGVAVFQAGAMSLTRLDAGKKLRGHKRLMYLRRAVCELARGSSHITVEGAAYERPQGQHKMGGMWWIIMHCLWLENPDASVVVVDPRTLKQYVLGKRSGEHDEVMLAAAKRYPDAGIVNNDTADAVVLAAMTLDVLGMPLAAVPKTHQAALASWPYKHIEEL